MNSTVLFIVMEYENHSREKINKNQSPDFDLFKSIRIIILSSAINITEYRFSPDFSYQQQDFTDHAHIS